MDKRRELINSESKLHLYAVMEVKTTIKQLKDCCATRYRCNCLKNQPCDVIKMRSLKKKI